MARSVTRMSDSVEERLHALGLSLPEAHAPAGGVIGVVVHGGTARTSGQLPREGGVLAVSGRLGDAVSLDEGRRAARLCVLNALAVLRLELGGLDRIERILSVTGFVACTPEFDQQPAVMDAASDLLVEIFGAGGRHSRCALGVAALPRGAAVEIEVTAAVRPA